ncbi:MAG: phage major capsid protein [Candidatus Xenobiia bacterium LiM19]
MKLTMEQLQGVIAAEVGKAVATEIAKQEEKRLAETPARKWMGTAEAPAQAPACIPNLRKEEHDHTISMVRVLKAQYYQKSDLLVNGRQNPLYGKDMLSIIKAIYPRDIDLQDSVDPEKIAIRQKAQMSESILSEGGSLVQPDYQSELIKRLGAETIIRQAGARRVPMPRGTTSYVKIVGGATFYWLAEQQAPTPSAPTTGELNLSAHDAMGIIPISNNLLHDMDSSVETQLRDDIITEYGRFEDSAFLRGVGASGSPKGMRYLAKSANITQTKGKTAALIAADLADLQLGLTGNDVKPVKPFWAMAPRSESAVFNMMNSNAQYIWLPEMMTGKLLKAPYFSTTAIPITLTSTKSEVYYADADKLLIAETVMMVLELVLNAAYDDGTGTVKSGLSKNQSVLKVFSRLDFNSLYTEAIAVKYDVEWGVA